MKHSSSSSSSSSSRGSRGSSYTRDDACAAGVGVGGLVHSQPMMQFKSSHVGWYRPDVHARGIRCVSGEEAEGQRHQRNRLGPSTPPL